MKSIVKKAGLEYSPNMIAASTDVQDVSLKRVMNMGFGIILIILALITGVMSIGILLSIFTSPYGWGTILGLTLLFLLMLVMTLFCSVFAYVSISSKSDWFFILYIDELLYKYRVDGSKEFKEIKLGIENLKKCFILRKEHVRIGKIGRRIRNIHEFHISVHFQYYEVDELKYIIIRHIDDYSEVNKALSYLQSEKEIPIYYNETYEGLKKADENHAYEVAKKITFSGDLKLYDKKVFTL